RLNADDAQTTADALISTLTDIDGTEATARVDTTQAAADLDALTATERTLTIRPIVEAVGDAVGGVAGWLSGLFGGKSESSAVAFDAKLNVDTSDVQAALDGFDGSEIAVTITADTSALDNALAGHGIGLG